MISLGALACLKAQVALTGCMNHMILMMPDGLKTV